MSISLRKLTHLFLLEGREFAFTLRNFVAQLLGFDAEELGYIGRALFAVRLVFAQIPLNQLVGYGLSRFGRIRAVRDRERDRCHALTALIRIARLHIHHLYFDVLRHLAENAIRIGIDRGRIQFELLVQSSTDSRAC